MKIKLLVALTIILSSCTNEEKIKSIIIDRKDQIYVHDLESFDHKVLKIDTISKYFTDLTLKKDR
jgi:hypothetical protein